MGTYFSKDLLRLIANRIDSEPAWRTFVFINTKTAEVGREMIEEKRKYFWELYVTELFKDIE